MRQNEYLFQESIIYTTFGVVCREKWCVLVQNDVRFAAKCSAFWC